MATVTRVTRPDDSWLARELAVSAFLGEAGCAVSRPSGLLPAGPHAFGGFHLSFWEALETHETQVDPGGAALELHRCHEVLREYAGELKPWAALVEASVLLELLIDAGVIEAEQAALLRATNRAVRERLGAMQLALVAVHGDAHLGNVVGTPNGPV